MCESCIETIIEKNMKLKILKVHWEEKQFNVFIEMYEFIR